MQKSCANANMNINLNHLAARQVLSRDLPKFSGRPEEGLLFISSFETLTETCNFLNTERLVRSQKSFKGRAFNSVRCRRLLPDAIHQRIDT